MDDLTTHPAVVRVTGLGQRLRAYDLRRPWVLDASVVAALVLLIGVPELFDRDGPEHLAAGGVGVAIALQAGLVVPLFWRRRRPVAVFAIVVAVFGLQWTLGILLRTDVALFVAIYNLALRARPRQLVWAAGATVAAMTLVAVRVSALARVGDSLVVAVMAVTGPAALAIAGRLRRAQLAALRDRAARLEAERDQRARLAAVTERNRVAREMHDIVGHNLSVIVTLAEGGAYASGVNPAEGTRALRLIAGTGRDALADLRRVLGILRAGDEDADLAPQPGLGTIAVLCEQIRAAGPRVDYRTAGTLDVVDPGLQLAAYRIVQEAMTNSLRHAGPGTRIALTVAASPGRLTLTIADTGPPGAVAGPRPASETAGQGLIGIRERAALYDGTVTAGPDPDGGWTVGAVLREPA